MASPERVAQREYVMPDNMRRPFWYYMAGRLGSQGRVVFAISAGGPAEASELVREQDLVGPYSLQCARGDVSKILTGVYGEERQAVKLVLPEQRSVNPSALSRTYAREESY
jgi:hypothetical protein